MSTLTLDIAAQIDTLKFQFQGQKRTERIIYETSDSTNYELRGFYAGEGRALAISTPIKRGKPSGLSKAFYPNGKTLFSAVYGWGALHGDWTEYDETGKVRVKGQFRQGERHGVWYFRDQELKAKYREGKKHGKWKYFSNGKIIRIQKYHRGKAKESRTFSR